MADLTVKIPDRDLGDFYLMVRDYTLHRGNTFSYLWNELRLRYPQIAQQYGDATESSSPATPPST